MTRVEKLKKIEGLASADFPENQTVGSVTKRGFEEFADRDGGKPVLRLPCFETDKVVLAHMNFGRVLDQDNPFIGGNEFPEHINE